MTNIYKRIGDIHKLEKIYLRYKETTKNENFDELYYNFKKKLDKSKTKSYSQLKATNYIQIESVEKKIVTEKSKDLEKNEYEATTQSNKYRVTNTKMVSFNITGNNLNTNSNVTVRNNVRSNKDIKEKYLMDLFNDDFLQENQGELNRMTELKKLNYV